MGPKTKLTAIEKLVQGSLRPYNNSPQYLYTIITVYYYCNSKADNLYP